MDVQQRYYVFPTTSQVHKRCWTQCSKNFARSSFVKMDGCWPIHIAKTVQGTVSNVYLKSIAHLAIITCLQKFPLKMQRLPCQDKVN